LGKVNWTSRAIYRMHLVLAQPFFFLPGIFAQQVVAETDVCCIRPERHPWDMQDCIKLHPSSLVQRTTGTTVNVTIGPQKSEWNPAVRCHG
jgi:hypothetical protein